jgi:hypothetical protein
MTITTVPSAMTLKLRFPEFEDVDSNIIEFALEEASLVLGTWSGAARNLCQMYLAAHLVAVTAATADANGREVISESIGRLSTSYARGVSAEGVGELNSTMYGKRYQALRQVGLSPLVVI